MMCSDVVPCLGEDGPTARGRHRRQRLHQDLRQQRRHGHTEADERRQQQEQVRGGKDRSLQARVHRHRQGISEQNSCRQRQYSWFRTGKTCL